MNVGVDIDEREHLLTVIPVARPSQHLRSRRHWRDKNELKPARYASCILHLRN